MYINNILNVSRYDQRHLSLRLKEEKLSRIYAGIADDLDLRARTQHRLLAVNLPDNLPTIAADRSSLSEVIMNLVDNAIKYSNEGGLIQVDANIKDDFVEVHVKDSGIGIPSSIVPHVFEKFYRSHRSRESTVGTGLGLYISQAIIESHGGGMSVQSEEGHGSTFSFTVPMYASVSQKLEAGDNQSLINTGKKKYIKNHNLYRE
jgi:signal transduction histidine kinase